LEVTGGSVLGSVRVEQQLAIGGAASKSIGGVLSNAGAGTWSGTGAVTALNGSEFRNLAGATFDVQAEAQWSSATGASVVNAGTLTKSGAGAARFGPNVAVGNTGTVAAQGGVLTVDDYVQSGSTSVTQLNGGELAGSLSIQGGTLEGEGQITGAVVLGTTGAATLAPGGVGNAGRLTVAGDLTLGPQATTAVELGGTVAGDAYDQVVVTQAAALDGTLLVELLGPFVPAEGAQFEVVSCTGGGCSGGLALAAPGARRTLGVSPPGATVGFTTPPEPEAPGDAPDMSDPALLLFGDLGGVLADDPIEEIVIVQDVSGAATDAVVTVQAQPLFPGSGSNGDEGSSESESTPGGSLREAEAGGEERESATLVCQ